VPHRPRAGRSRAFVRLPSREIDAEARRARHTEPHQVFQATRPPFNPGSAIPRSPSYVEGLWSPSLGGRRRKGQAKADANASVTFHATLRVFLSQAGPRFNLVLLQAGHHLVVPFVSRIAFRNEKGDPLGRPRLARSAARDLAQLPPSEGMDVSGPALRIEALPARLEPGDGRRLDDVLVGVDSSLHGPMVVAGSEHRGMPRDAQGFQTNI